MLTDYKRTAHNQQKDEAYFVVTVESFPGNHKDAKTLWVEVGRGYGGGVRHGGRAEGEQKLKIIQTDNALGMVKKSTQGQRTQKTEVSKVRVEPVPLSSPHSADPR